VQSNRALVHTGLLDLATGGGIHAAAADASTLSLLLDHSIVTRNTAHAGGGLDLRVEGTSTLTGQLIASDVSRNRASTTGGQCCLEGGGIKAFADDGASLSLEVDRSTVGSNRTEGAGPGMWVHASGPLSLALRNSAVAGNYGVGHAISVQSYDAGGTLDVVNTAISRNPTERGLAVFTGASLTINLINAIIWGNATGAPDLVVSGIPGSSATINADHSDIGSTGFGPDVTFNDLGGNVDTDPQFRDRRCTHLRASSPLIDAGTCAGAPPIDIDGDLRPIGGGCDIGPDEVVP
jgi:hypothetical protein